MNENRAKVLEAVLRVLEDLVLQGKTVDENQFLSDMGLDSLDKIEIAIELEMILNIYIQDESLENIETVSDLVNKVTQLYTEQIK